MKKIVSVLLAGIMVCGLSVNAFALRKISDVRSDFKPADYVVSAVRDGRYRSNISAANLGDYDASPGDAIRIYLKPEMFVDSAGNMIRDNEADIVTTSMLSSGKIAVRKATAKGSNLLKSIALKNDKKNGAYIELKFVEYFVSVDEKDFDINVYLTVNKKKRTSTQIKIAGTLSNEIIEVDDGDDYVSLSEGEVAEAQSYIRKIDVDMGNGVYITTSMNRGMKYYGVADPAPTAADEVVFSKNASVDQVYNIKTVNIRKTGNTVFFDLDYTSYVYNASGKYLGTTKDKVAFSTKYYLSSKKVSSIKIK